ncbi:MAG: hypothetical protein AB8B56_17175 [Crocinitomicaceae bacterium]
MGLDENLLDDYEKSKALEVEASKFVRRVLIVTGILLTVIGGLYLIGLTYDFYRMYEYMTSGFSINFFSWDTWLLNKSLAFLYAISFVLGGIGLLRRKIIGWIFGVASTIFGIFNILFFVFWFGSDIDKTPGAFGWILFAVAVFFGLIVFFLLRSSVRKYFAPTTKSYIFLGILFAIFTTDLLVVLIIPG